MGHPGRIARIGNAAGKLSADTHLPLCLGQQKNTAVRGQPATIEGGSDFLACDRWESNFVSDKLGHGGCSLWLLIAAEK
jgi:hypothetical protein